MISSIRSALWIHYKAEVDVGLTISYYQDSHYVPSRHPDIPAVYSRVCNGLRPRSWLRLLLNGRLQELSLSSRGAVFGST